MLRPILLVLLSIVGLVGPAAANPAARHWSRGQRLAANGDREGALLELREAFELVPSPAVLMDIARLHGELGRPLEAKRAIDRLLAFPGALSRRKLDEALRLQAEQARRIARLRLVPERSAWLVVDARPVEGAATAETTVILNPGRHVVSASADGSIPAVRVIDLRPGGNDEIFLELPAMQNRKPGALVVRTELPGADVVVDGHVVGVTPLAGAIPLAPGPREVVLARPGYRATPRMVTIRDGEAAAIELEADVDPAAPDAVIGRLVVQASEPDVSITLNGLPRGPYKEPMQVPVGAHRLKIERNGFDPVERTVDVSAGTDAVVTAALDPTPATRGDLAREAHARRRWAKIAIGAGSVAAVAATTWLVINQGQMNDAQNELNALDDDRRRNGGGACDPTLPTTNVVQCDRKRAAAEDHLVTLNFRRVLGVASLGMAVGAIGMGLVHVFTGPKPDQYDEPNTPLPMARAPRPRLSWMPLVDHTGEAAGVTLSGRF